MTDTEPSTNAVTNYDKFFLLAVSAFAGTVGGYAGTIGLTSKFNILAFGICNLTTAAGAALGIWGARQYFPTQNPAPRKPDSDNVFIRHYEKQNPEPLTQAEQNAIFWAFMKDSGKTFAGFFLGAALGLGVGYGTVKTVEHFAPPPVEQQKVPETIKDIRDLGYWNRELPAP